MSDDTDIKTLTDIIAFDPADDLSEFQNGRAPEDHPRRCKAHSSQTPQRCKRWAMKGQQVCPFHGGNTKKARAAAQRRLFEEFDPMVANLLELAYQSEHAPTRLGATKLWSNISGLFEQKADGNRSTGPQIVIGFLSPDKPPQITADVRPGFAAADDYVEDGDLIDEETERANGSHQGLPGVGGLCGC